VIGHVVFPCESIDIRIVEACVLEEAGVVVDTPMVVLVPRGRQGKTGLQVQNGRLVRFGVDFDIGLSSTSLEVEGR
jgi:hypothetical protein